MNKADLVSIIAHEAGIKDPQASKALEATLKAITGALKKGDKVTLVGFGTFSVAERAARTGRNPRTNQPIDIPRRRVPKFKPGKKLSESVK